MKALRLIDRLVGYASGALAFAGAVAIVLLMLHVVVDVTGRYLFNHPFPGTLETVTYYYMVMVTALPFAYVTRAQGQIAVEMFTSWLPARWVHLIDAVAGLLMLLYVGVLAWKIGPGGRRHDRPRRGARRRHHAVHHLAVALDSADRARRDGLGRGHSHHRGRRRDSCGHDRAVRSLPEHVTCRRPRWASSSSSALLALLALRVPIGVALGSVSFAGIWHLRGLDVALGMLRSAPYDFLANWELSAIPMFILMGSVAHHSGISSALFTAARLWLGRLPGGLAVATNFACAGFAAASGSSVAASAAMGKIAIPEMLKAGYAPSLATGTVAAAGTLAALIPPSILFVLYGIFAETSVTKLLIAGILPGLLTAGDLRGHAGGALPHRSRRSRRRSTSRRPRASAGARCSKSGRSPA